MHIVEKTFKNFVEKNIGNRSCYIAYSGGVDSQVLLHLSAKYIKSKVTALHVNHGISNNANKWTSFCEAEAKRLDANFKVSYFKLKNQNSNLEEIAREKRHGFFKENIGQDEVLFTGHHLDDQAETFMLRLMRGSGVDGLSSMSSIRQYEKGFLMRPLLEVSKEEIKDYALKNDIKWVEDESNASSDYDRNFLRNEVLPLLKTRWKEASRAISRSAKHCNETKTELKSREEETLREVTTEKNTIIVEELKKESQYNQSRIVRLWLEKNGQKMPTKKNLSVILKEVVFSRSDSQACFKTKDYTIRKSFGELHLIDENIQPKDFLKPMNTVAISPESNMKMEYKGKERTFKYIMKAEKVPYWERELYTAFVSNEDNKVIAFGDIKKS